MTDHKSDRPNVILIMVGDHGIGPAYQGYLRDDCVTIAEALKEGGYRAYMSGKWHVGGPYKPM